MSNSANGTELGREVEEAGPNLAGQHIATALGHDVDGVGGSGGHVGGPMHDDAHGCGGVGAQSRLPVLLTCWGEFVHNMHRLKEPGFRLEQAGKAGHPLYHVAGNNLVGKVSNSHQPTQSIPVKKLS